MRRAASNGPGEGPSGSSSLLTKRDSAGSTRPPRDTCGLFAGAFANLLKSFLGIGLLTFPFAASLVGLPVFLAGTIIIVLLVRVSMLLLLWTDDSLERSAAAGSRKSLPSKRTYPIIVHLALTSSSNAGWTGKAIYWACLLAIVLGQLGTLVGYLQFLGSNLSQLIPSLKLQTAVVVAASIALLPSLIPKMRALSPFSAVGMLSLVSALIAFAIYCSGAASSSAFDSNPGAGKTMQRASDVWLETKWSGLFRFAGIALFAAEGITALPSIKYSLARERKSLANGDLMRLMDIALLIMTVLLLSFGAFGWSCLGVSPPSIVTQGLVGNTAVTKFIKATLTIYILCTYPLQLFPAMEAVEELLLARSSRPSSGASKKSKSGNDGDGDAFSGVNESGPSASDSSTNGDAEDSDDDDEDGDDHDSEDQEEEPRVSSRKDADSALREASGLDVGSASHGATAIAGNPGHVPGTVTPRRTLTTTASGGSLNTSGPNSANSSNSNSGQETPVRSVSAPSALPSGASQLTLPLSAAVLSSALGKPPLAPQSSSSSSASASGKDKPFVAGKRVVKGRGSDPGCCCCWRPSTSAGTDDKSSVPFRRMFVWCCGKEVLQCCGGWTGSRERRRGAGGNGGSATAPLCIITRGPGKLLFTSLLRTCFVVISAAIASQLKSFGVVISFIGWLAFGVLSFVLPPLMYVRLVPEVFPSSGKGASAASPSNTLPGVAGAAAPSLGRASTALIPASAINLQNGEHWWVWSQRVEGHEMLGAYTGADKADKAGILESGDQEKGKTMATPATGSHTNGSDGSELKGQSTVWLPPACYSAWCAGCASCGPRKDPCRSLWSWERAMLWGYLIGGTCMSIAGMAMVVVEAMRDKSGADSVGGGSHA